MPSRVRSLGWSTMLPASVLLAFFALADRTPAPATGAAEIASLAAGERPLRAEETHRYRVELAEGDFLELDVEQLGIDLRVAVLDPAVRQLFQVDSPYGDRESETVLLVAEVAGPYTVEIRAGPRGTGAYRVHPVIRRRATDGDRIRAAAARLYDAGERQRRRKPEADHPRALEHYHQAAALWHSAGDRVGEALACHRIGQVQLSLGDRQAALVAYRDACRLAEAAQRPVRLADLRFAIGRMLFDDAEYRAAVRAFGDAAELYAQLGDLLRQARSVNRIAWSHERLGELDAARRFYRQSLALGRDLGDLAWQAAALNNLGEVDLRLGRPQVALERFREALAHRRRSADERGEAVTLTSLGTALRRLGELEEAREHFVAAWKIQHRLGDRKMLANTLVGLGLTELGLGRLDAAERALRAAVQVAGDAGRHRTEAMALVDLGEVYEARGAHREALDRVGRALPILRRLGDLQGEASAAFVIARNQRALDQLAGAREWLELAIERMETIREQTRPELLRASYFAFKHRYYEAYIDLLMELHERDPQAGSDVEAFRASERSRARVLHEFIAVGDAGRPTAEILREHRIDLASETAPERSERPAPGTAWTRPRIPDLDELQQRILDPETLLVEITLGEERSHLWAVDTSSIGGYRLPAGRAQLGTLARQAHRTSAESRTPSARVQAQLALRDLSRIVLGPIAERLGRRRLVVVGDGPLQGVPWAVLPDPRTLEQEEPVPLVVSHEVVTAPSVAVVEALRGKPRSWSKTLAVIANPVFTADDPRLPPGPPTTVAAHQSADPEAVDLPPLPFSAGEAAAILAFVAPHQRFAALGFDANLDLVQGGVLFDVRFLHFATHGLVDAEHPERSRLALSHFDARGRPRSGMLEARAIAGLDLAADLVVLSACHTAFGPELRGEGLMSLARVFLLAGASRVVVSLWRADDRATAALMERFYRALLVDGLTPPAALRSAQLVIRAEEDWQAPYFWAGFVLQGDWR